MRRVLRWTRSFILRLMAAVIVLLAIAALAGFLIVRSGWFREQIRDRVLVKLTRAPGGRADLGHFNFDWSKMTATVDSLVVHGNEGASDPPFIRVGSVAL